MKTEKEANRGAENCAAGGHVVEPFIDKEELGRRLALSPRTIDAWMRRGFLPYYKPGRVIRFKWSEVEEHLARQHRVVRELASEAKDSTGASRPLMPATLFPSAGQP